eukprot:gene18999-24817_t
MPHLTTHVLDTSKGIPASDLLITLQYNKNIENELEFQWNTINETRTNIDGRAPDLLTEETILTPVSSDHYHVPLLLSPFGYSTYRGS